MDEFDELDREIREKRGEIEETKKAMEKLEEEPVMFTGNRVKVEQCKANLMKGMSKCQVRISEMTRRREELREEMRKGNELKRIKKIFVSPMVMKEASVEERRTKTMGFEREPLAILCEV